MNNPFLAQRAFNRAVRSLSKEKKRLLAQCLLSMVSDFQQHSTLWLKAKYCLEESE